MKTLNVLKSSLTILFFFYLTIGFSQYGNILDWTKISSTNGVSSLLNNGYFGWDCDTLGDLNQDGIMDLVVGAPQTNSNSGQIQILFMNSNKTVKYSKMISGASNSLNISSTLVGTTVCNIGDFNHDGTNDIAIGCENQNKVYLAMLDTSGGVLSTIDIGGNYTGYFGCDIINLGDIDNDGVVDLAISGYYNGIYIIKLNANGSIKSSNMLASYSSVGYGMNDNFAHCIRLIDDLDGNGRRELVASAHTANGAKGEIAILYLNTNYSVLSYTKIGSNSTNFTSLNNNDYFGGEIQNVGDLNGDGIKDLFVSAHCDDDGASASTNYGAVYAICLNTNGTVKSYYKIGHSSESFFHILSPGDMFGLGISFIGDINNDLKLDILVGAIGDDAGGTDRGAAYIFTISSLMNAINSNTISEYNTIIYPNPNTGIVNIQSKSIDEIEIFDINGKLIKQILKLNSNEGIIEIDLSYIAKGTYIVKINKHNTIETKRIIIQ